MTGWLIFMLVLAAIGLVTGGPTGFFGGIGVALVIFPFWFLTWAVYFYEAPPPPPACHGNYASIC